MKLIEKFRHKFKGYGVQDSEVVVHIYEGIVILQDIGVGTSVTNSVEILVKEISELKKLDKVRWFEIYPYYDKELVEIKFNYNEMSEVFSLPKWEIVKEKELLLITQTINHETENERGAKEGNLDAKGKS